MPKLLLIQAGGGSRKGLSSTQSKYPSLALGIVAALTPPTWEIKVLDCLCEDFTNHEADLVAITAYTPTIKSAYSISRHYRSRNIPVVIGGIHATLLPEEVIQYCDTVVTGEAENVWPEIIRDFEKGELKKIYHSTTGSNHFVAPDRKYSNPAFKLTNIQASRGCPNNCDFCSVTLLSGKTFRKRPVDEIIRDWKNIKEEFVWFSDDNLFGFSRQDREWAGNLFSEITQQQLVKNWMCFAGVHSLTDEKTIALAAESGCKIIYIGFETLDPVTLKSVNKNPEQVRYYNKVIGLLHKYGISVLAGIMLGFDYDTPDTIERRIDFVLESDIDSYFLTVTTPMPGTRLFNRYRNEGRLRYTHFPEDWTHFDWTQMVYKPEKMTILEAEEAIGSAYQKAYAYQTIKDKYRNTRNLLNSPDTAMLNYLSNMDFRSTFLKQQ